MVRIVVVVAAMDMVTEEALVAMTMIVNDGEKCVTSLLLLVAVVMMVLDGVGVDVG